MSQPLDQPGMIAAPSLVHVPERNAPAAASRAARKSPPNAMTIDVEDYFQVEAFRGVIRRSDWDGAPARVDGNTDKVLGLLADAQVRATFFVLGWVAERFPEIVRRIATAGHEVASHGFAHERVDDQRPEQFRDDVVRAKAVLEDVSGARVRGYRAPTFSINRKNWWAYEVLAEAGYEYSSSVYPIRHDLYGMANAPRIPFRPMNAPFLEIPMSTVRLFGRNLPCSGGGFFRLLPYQISKTAMRYATGAGRMPCVFYCHPWEFDPGQPRIQLASAKSRFRHYVNIERMQGRYARLLRDFSWDRMDNVFLEGRQTASGRP